MVKQVTGQYLWNDFIGSDLHGPQNQTCTIYITASVTFMTELKFCLEFPFRLMMKTDPLQCNFSTPSALVFFLWGAFRETQDLKVCEWSRHGTIVLGLPLLVSLVSEVCQQLVPH